MCRQPPPSLQSAAAQRVARSLLELLPRLDGLEHALDGGPEGGPGGLVALCMAQVQSEVVQVVLQSPTALAACASWLPSLSALATAGL